MASSRVEVPGFDHDGFVVCPISEGPDETGVHANVHEHSARPQYAIHLAEHAGAVRQIAVHHDANNGVDRGCSIRQHRCVALGHGQATRGVSEHAA